MRAPALILSLLILVPAAGVRAGPPGASSGEEKHRHSHDGVPERLPEHPAVGDTAPDFSLQDSDGRSWALGEFLGRGHLILMFGSVSGDRFRQAVPELNRLAREWERLEVRAVLVYTREAHPATLRGRAPGDYPQRVALARQVRSDLEVDLLFLVDEWSDPVHRAYGSVPDSAFLLDRKGSIVLRQIGVNPSALARELRRQLRIPEAKPPSRPSR